MKKKILADLTQEDDGTVTDRTQTFAWTIQDEAIHRGVNFAEVKSLEYQMLMHDEGMTFEAVLKNAYQEGFLHGFEHKFDNTNYEEK